MPHQRQRLGGLCEEIAARHLRRAGCRVVARNARIRYAELGIAGELDIVVLDADALVFVEVKALRAGAAAGPARAAEAVGPRKQRRLRRLARAWLASERVPRHARIRFDVIGVTVGPGPAEAGVEWIRNAF